MSEANKPENPFISIFINILAPSLILSKGHAYLAPVLVLVLALALPIGYGLIDYIQRRHKNYVSLLGIINTLITGGLALNGAEGIWFAVKEASLPLLLGILVLGSAWTKRTAAEMMFCNPQLMNLPLIQSAIESRGRHSDYRKLLINTTLWLSGSFFISAIANFLLAIWIFEPIRPELAMTVREELLNQQIGKMNWMGFVVIAGPLTVFSGILVYRFLHKLAEFTGEPINNLLKS